MEKILSLLPLFQTLVILKIKDNKNKQNKTEEHRFNINDENKLKYFLQ